MSAAPTIAHDVASPAPWATAARELVGASAGSRAATRADWHAARAGALIDPARTRFAVLLLAADRPRVEALLGDPGVTAWALRTARTVLRLSTAAEGPPPHLDLIGRAHRVHIEAGLGPLPHLGLALEHAETAGVWIVVRARQVAPGVDGVTWRTPVRATWTVRGARTTRDVQLVDVDPDAPDVAAVWAHELGHVLDPRTDRTPEAAEDFADLVGELLQRHRPARLVDLQQLLTATTDRQDNGPDQGRRNPAPAEQYPSVVLPGDGIDSLLAWARLPITTTS